MNPIKGMKFRKFLSRFHALKSQEKVNINHTTSPKKSTTTNNLLKINDNFSTPEELNKALKHIDKLISKDGAKNNLLLRKADLLLRKYKFKQARQLLTELQDDKKDQKTAKRAKRLLNEIHHLQQQATTSKNNEFNNKLQLIIRKYDQESKHLPDPQDPSFNLNITLFIRKEAGRARKSELPMLSLELIEHALQAKLKSPWLLLGKAISLDMMGEQAKALRILEELKQTNKGEKITQEIESAILDAQKRTKNYRATKFNIYLAKHLQSTSKSHKINTTFLPDIENINAQSRVKALIFKEALNALPDNPEASLNLLNAILAFVPKDGAALQLKGEALIGLKKSNQAIQIWADLSQSKNKEIAKTASESISKFLARKAKRISAHQSPLKAINFYIEEHLNNHLIPTPTKIIKDILEQIKPSNEDFFDPELRQHQIQLQFNTFLIDHLEMRLRKKGRLDAGEAAQKPFAIRKTASKAG